MTTFIDSFTERERQMPEIYVVDYKLMERPCLRGLITISLLPGLLISGIGLFEKNGNKWLNWPGREWKDQQGQPHSTPVITFVSAELERVFRHAVLEALAKYQLENGDAR